MTGPGQPSLRRRAGRAALRYWHEPRAYLQWLARRGPRGAWQAVRGEAAMKRAAERLAPIPDSGGAELLRVSFMTGRRFWHQTAFCAHSLARQCEGAIHPVFYDDGSLAPDRAAVLQRLFPHGEVIGAAQSRAALEARLPAAKFPLLHETRKRVPLFRKLVDLRGTAAAWQLYLDSDMLFFRRPAFLEAAASGRRACFMADPVFGYCLPPEEMRRLAGGAVPPNVNCGILGMDNDRIDWELVESWLGEIPPAVRRHRLFEQSLSAIIISRFDPVAAPPADYVVVCDPAAAPPAGAVLVHYIQHSKWRYLAEEWRRCPQTGNRSAAALPSPS